MSDRRSFIKNVFGGLVLAGAGAIPSNLFAKEEFEKITILHTNDVHSRIDPFPMNDPKYPGLGGAARREVIIKKIREQEKNVLLFDCGDIFQGTPYFNLYGGELEMKLMSRMGYDAATLGNHDFDNGIDGLAKAMQHMNFPFLNVNYNFSDSPLNGKIGTFKVFSKGNLKIGVFGVGIELKGLVDDKMSGNIRYDDPLQIAQKTATMLKNDCKCDLVICISHLGFKYSDKKISDEVMAKNTSDIDLIIGGHTHTFLDNPVRYMNIKNSEVLVGQVGWAGIRLGRIDFYFDHRKKKKQTVTSSVKICENTIAT